MSQKETASSQNSTDTQETREILSQGAFDEIWESLNRTFSDPDKIIEGFMTNKLPLEVEYKDKDKPDNLKVKYEEFTCRSPELLPYSPTAISHSVTELLPPAETLESNRHMSNNDHTAVMVNGSSMRSNVPFESGTLPVLLPNNNRPGQFDFRLDYEPNNDPITKATPWVYIADRQKLFVKMQSVCPIIFKITGTPPPGSGIRGILMYKKPEHYQDLVTRCPNHKNMCKDGHPYKEHVMRCENLSTIYESCPKTNRLSLFIPLSAVNFVAGENWFKLLFKFTCFNSCIGGMNRRPTYLLFRLECGKESFGRAVVEIRICASPGRDSTEKEASCNQKSAKNTDKRNEPTSTTDIVLPALPNKHSPASSPTTTYPPRASVLMSAKDSASAPEPFQFPSAQEQQNKRQYPVLTDGIVCKRIKRMSAADSTDDEIFTIRVRGKERFDIVSKIVEGLHMIDGITLPDEPPSPRYVNNGVTSSQEFTKIQPKAPSVEIKKEKPDSSECHIKDVSPQSSQENFSQLSRTSSNASSQSTQNCSRYNISKVTMKRTITLKKASFSEDVLCEK